MIVRKAERKYIEAIINIFKEEYSKEPYFEKWSDDSALKKINEYFKNNFIYVAEINNEVVGFIIASTSLWHDGLRGHIDEIVIRDKFQGKGIGKELMRTIESEFKKRGVVVAGLFTKKGAKAIGFYNKLGYKESDLIHMEKKIK